ncbi:hypothetical protein GW17_00025442 [Ensete ventricosum]|nr:hypothetical protein GW17_00025442 [Ensete ventricosum]
MVVTGRKQPQSAVPPDSRRSMYRSVGGLKRSVDGGKQAAPVKKLKKDKLVGATGKNVRSETSTVPVAPRVKPDLTLPIM